MLVGYLGVTGRFSVIAGLTATQWAWALGTGVLLAGYVATWLAALQRAPAALVASVLVIGAPITAILQAIANGSAPSAPILLGQLAIALGVGAMAVVALWATRRSAATVS